MNARTCDLATSTDYKTCSQCDKEDNNSCSHQQNTFPICDNCVNGAFCECGTLKHFIAEGTDFFTEEKPFINSMLHQSEKSFMRM